jgi:outer membrane protein OmpA-like peptidoglycan-associated protein
MRRTLSYAVVICAVALLGQACASSQHRVSFAPGSINTEKYVKKVDQFVVIADGSLSMADRSQGQRKLSISEDLLASLNQTIPSLDYEGGLRTFGRGLCGSEGKTVSIIQVADYLSSAYGDGVARYGCANGTSPLNLAIDAASADLVNKGRPTAIVIVSDGLNMGQKEIAAARSVKAAFGDNLTIYAVQIGTSSKGRKLLQQVVKEGGAGSVKEAPELSSADAMEAFVVDVFLWPDDDGDGVANHLDKCPDTPKGVTVDSSGCPIDSDGDGVPDYLDKCPGTPKGTKVDASGCPIDSDGDGVPDALDKCPGTPRGVEVDAKGCPVDSDGDGVPDYLDKCPGTLRGVPVDEVGCPLAGIEVAGNEWFVRGKVLFAVNKATLNPEAQELLLRIASFLKKNTQYVVEIQGNTDSTGPMAWNMELSKKRADAVRDFLVGNGVGADRLSTKGFGPNEPIASNDTAEGRAMNRRVDFAPSER